MGDAPHPHPSSPPLRALGDIRVGRRGAAPGTTPLAGVAGVDTGAWSTQEVAAGAAALAWSWVAVGATLMLRRDVTA